MLTRKVCFFSALLSLFIGGFVLNSCNKKFDEPPYENVGTDTSRKASIKNLIKKFNATTGNFTYISEDSVIRGIVTANDKSGNFYKTIVIQDDSAAICLSLDAVNLYTTYPVGREVIVHCKGLYLANVLGTYQLCLKSITNGTTSDLGIPNLLVNNFVTRGTYNNVVKPILVPSISSLNSSYNNMLIKLDSLQLQGGSLGYTYSDTTANKNQTRVTLQRNCNITDTIQLNTSAFASFAGSTVPYKRGSVIGIYQPYQKYANQIPYKQLTIRDTTDVDMRTFRCGEDPNLNTLFSEDFELVTSNKEISLANWSNNVEVGTKKYIGYTSTDKLNKYAMISAYQTTDNLLKSWLVSPGINLGAYKNKILLFNSNNRFPGSAVLKVLVSTNYSGISDPWDSSVIWDDITSVVKLSPKAASDNKVNFVSSDSIRLNKYSGKISVAFKYEGGTAGGNTNNWGIDDLRVLGY